MLISEEQLHLVKDYYLWTLVELHTLAIAQSADNEMLMSVVTKEVELGHIAGFFRMRRRLGMYERMAPALEEGAGGGPANAVNGEAARHLNPEY